MRGWSDRDLQRWLKLWQRRLRLQDWGLVARRVATGEMGGRGECRHGLSVRQAVIRIASDLTPDEAEHTLIHELLHCHWSHYAPTGTDRALHEAAIESVAYALRGR